MYRYTYAQLSFVHVCHSPKTQQMDNKLSVHRKRSPKQPKAKKKPIKVVYISNPMRVETSVSEFRALVQELTGQDSDFQSSSLPPDFSKFKGIVAADDLLKAPGRVTRSIEDGSRHLEPISGMDPSSESSSSTEWFDDIFTPQMMESFTGYCLPII